MPYPRLTYICVALLLAACATPPTAKTANGIPLAARSVRTLKRDANKGDIAAQVELATRYGTGTGVKKDYAKAVELLQKPATAGDPLAEYYMGTAYAAGAGVAKDEAQAVIWYERAAAQQQRDAAYNLALMVINGQGGISPTWAGAISLLEIAAKQDVPQAQILLGNAYATGAGVDKDPETAATWYRRAMTILTDKKPASVRLRILIDRGEVKWQPGDPGDPPGSPAQSATAPSTSK